MKTARFALPMLAALILAQAGSAFAYYPRPYPRPGYGDGVSDGITAGIASVYSTLTTGENARYNDDSLVQAAALRQEGEASPLFNAFAATMKEQYVATYGDSAIAGLSAEAFDSIIVQTILTQAAQK